MPLVTKQYDIAIMGLNFTVSPVSTGTATVSIRKKGTSVLMASATVPITSTVNVLSQPHIELTADLSAELTKNTVYEIVVEATGKIYAPNIPKDALTENDYFDFGTGAAALAPDCGGFELFCGFVRFYAGEGAVLKPDVKTNIGIVGTALNTNGRVVVVQAQEDTTVSIDYRPAYL